MQHNFIEFNFRCDKPEVEWFNHILRQLPTYRTVDVIGLELRKVDSIIYLNDDGQVVNLARSKGTDRVNEKGIRESFLRQGINTNFVPPVILDTDELIDGFTRQSVLVGLGTQEFVYLVVKLKDGFVKEDAIDELGLGLNLHPQSKKAVMSDFKKRLSNFIVRTEETSKEKFTLNQGIKWFEGIPNNYTDDEIANAVEDQLKKIRSLENMESFTKSIAEKKASELLNVKKSDIVAFNSSSSTYMDRGIVEILDYFDKNASVPKVVGFLDKVEAEDAESVRKKILEHIKIKNDVMVKLLQEYNRSKKQGIAFQFIDFVGFLPQVLGKESDIVN